MKKSLGIVVALMVAVSFSAFAADPFVTDTVGVTYDAGDTIALLGIDTGDVDLIWSNSYSASTPGAQPVNESGATSAAGSSLRYTLYGLTSAKITASANVADKMSVKVTSIDRGTTSGKEGMTVSATELGVPVASAKTLTATDQDIVTGISGANTWTGWATGDGAQLEYDLVVAPGATTTIIVTYTLVTTI